MRMRTVEELLDMEPGDHVAGARGKLSAIFERKTGSNDNGEWSVQPCMLKGKNGDEIKVKFWNHKPINRSLRGASVWILAEEGKKGPVGMTIKENEYKGKTTLELNVDERATLTENEPEANSTRDEEAEEDSTEPPGGWQGAARGRRDDPENRQPRRRNRETEDEPPKRRARDEQDDEPPKPKKKTPLAAVSDVRGQVKRLAVLHQVCEEIAEGLMVRWESRTAGCIKADKATLYQSFVASLFIAADKRNMEMDLPERMPEPGDDGKDPSDRTEGGDDDDQVPGAEVPPKKRAKAAVED